MRLLLTVTNNFAFKDRQQKARTILIMQTDSETIKSSNSASKNTKGITIFLFQIVSVIKGVRMKIRKVVLLFGC